MTKQAAQGKRILLFGHCCELVRWGMWLRGYVGPQCMSVAFILRLEWRIWKLHNVVSHSHRGWAVRDRDNRHLGVVIPQGIVDCCFGDGING